MKKISFFSIIFFFVTSLSAQVNLTECSIIVLENDNEVIALINGIQSGQLFYQKCPDSTSQRFSIPVDIIKYIRETNGEIYLPLDYTVLPIDEDHVKQFNSWIFINKFNNKIKTINRQQNVKVVYKDSAQKMQRVKGKWESLTNATLTIGLKTNAFLSIPKKDIVKIVVFKRKRELGKKIWVALLALGVSFFGTIVFGIIEGSGQPILGCLGKGLLFTLIVTLGVMIAFAFRSKTIKYPFKGEWEIINPANELNDVRDFYKQP